MTRYFVNSIPRKGKLDSGSNQSLPLNISGVALCDTLTNENIIRSTFLQNSIYNSVFGVVANETADSSFILSNTNTDPTDISHSLFRDKYFIAFHNPTTGQKFWLNGATPSAWSHLQSNWETFKETYIFGPNGDTFGFSEEPVTFYQLENTSSAARLASLLSAFDTNNPEYDLNGDGTVNAKDLSQALSEWETDDNFIGIKANGFKYSSNIEESNNKIYHFFNNAVNNNQSVTIEFSDTLTSIPFLVGATGITQPYSPYKALNYPSIPLDGSAVVYWVSPSGSNSNSGLTSNAPLRTLQAAGDALMANNSFKTNNASKKPGYIVLMDGTYSYDTLGYSGLFPLMSSTTERSVLTARSGNSQIGFTFNNLTIMSQNILGAKINGGRLILGITSMNGLTANIKYVGLSGYSGANPIFGISMDNLNEFYGENALITNNPVGGQGDSFSANKIKLTKSFDNENYDYEDWQNSEYYPVFKNAPEMVADGLNPKDLIKSSQYFELIFTRAFYSGPDFRVPNNVPTTSSLQAFNVNGFTSINAGGNGTYVNGRTTFSLQNHMEFYNWLLNKVPSGQTLTNYFNDSTLYVNTADNNKAGFRFTGINCANKTVTFFGDLTESGSLDLIYKATILGHPQDLNYSFPGQWAIGNTFANGGKYRLLINPFEKVGGVTFTDIGNISVPIAPCNLVLKDPYNVSVVGFEFRDSIKRAVDTYTNGTNDPNFSFIIKYCLGRDVGDNFMLTNLPNTVIDSNLIMRTKVRPITLSSPNSVARNNVILDWISKTGIIITGTNAKDCIVEGNLLYGRDGSHVNSFAVYAGAKDFIFRNNGTYTQPNENYYGINFNEVGVDQKYGIVHDNVFATGTLRPGRATNRFIFEHNFVRGYENNFYEYEGEDVFPWWGMWESVFRNNICTSGHSSYMLEYPRFAFANGGNENYTFNPCQRDFQIEPGYTSAIYNYYIEHPEYFDPKKLTGPGTFAGLTAVEGCTFDGFDGNFYSPNDNYFGYLQAPLFGVDLHRISSRAAPMVFKNPYNNSNNLPNFYNNVFLKRASFNLDDYQFGLVRSGSSITEYVSESDFVKTGRYLSRNYYHTLDGSNTLTTKPGSTLANNIFENSDEYNFKLLDDAKVIPYDTYIPQTVLNGATYNSPNDNLYKTTYIKDIRDTFGDYPGPRWTNHPPSDPYAWWLWQENVGFYGEPE